MHHSIRRAVVHSVLVFVLVAGAIPALTQTTAAATIAAGTLVKSPSSTAVYEIAEDNGVLIRLVFQMQSVYESWYGKDFSAVVTLPDAELNKYPIRKVKSFKPGSVVKSPSLPKVYRVSSPLVLEWIENESDFFAFGYAFSQVKDIPDGFFTSYKVTGSATPPVATPPAQPTPPANPEPPAPEPVVTFEISSRSFTPDTKATGSIFVKTTKPSDATLSYSPVFSAEAPKKLSSTKQSTEHTFQLTDLIPKTKYSYILTAVDPDTQVSIEESGSFISYYDFLVSAHGSAPTKGSLKQEKVEVGTFVVYNNSKIKRTINELWFQFAASNPASDKVTRTIDIVDITPSSAAYGSTITFKTVASGTTIRNMLAIQKFQLLEIDVEPGSQRVFSVRINNLENMNPGEFDGSSFVTSVEYLGASGESEVYLYTKEIGTRFHTLN